MPLLRNRLASITAGGPREFGELRDKVILSVKDQSQVGDALSELDNFALEGRELSNFPVVIAEPREDPQTVLERFQEVRNGGKEIRKAIQDIEVGDGEIIETTSSVVEATTQVLQSIRSLDIVDQADFARSYTDFGPENLRFSPDELDTVDPQDVGNEPDTMEELNSKMGMEEAWQETRGENAIVAIFDTGYAEGLIETSRIRDTFSGSGVDGPFAPAEGHGTMTAGAAVASKEDGAPFNGTAPGAEVFLVRITDDKGQIRGDIISEAWDWLADKNTDKPIVANHSYGTPICSGRPRAKFCSGPEIRLIKRINADQNITSFYAAGNEAGRCGHRPSGLTNAITGLNSLSEVITVGALRFDGLDAQRYSSHGRGDCAPIADPKPNVSNALPNKTYYGVEGGWKIKDMSTGIGGSSGGTSHASPSVAGLGALLQSKSMDVNGEPLQTEELKQILHEAADPPRPTQINLFDGFVGKDGYDARFGHGEVDINQALSMV